MFRTAVQLTAAVVVAGAAVSACGTVQMGAAATTGADRISTATLTSQVANLHAAYVADQAKGIKPQRPVALATQQVLTWLIVFRIYDEVAAQHHISISPAQRQAELSALTMQAAQNKITLAQYVSAAGALPPDLIPQLGDYFAIQSALARQANGGKLPTTPAEQTQVRNAVGHAQCMAAKSLSLKVNPQYGQFDYSTYQVVPKPPGLAAAPAQAPATSHVVTKPPC